MASPQPDIFIRDGKAYTSLEYVNTILASQSENPSRLVVVCHTGPDGRAQFSLKVEKINTASVGDQNILGQHGNGPFGHQKVGDSDEGVEPGNRYYQDERLLLEQLQDLHAKNDDTLEQLLTGVHPRVLNHLEKAHGTLIRLATADDGRVFSVRIGSTVESQWMRNYPEGHLETRMTPYQVNIMEEVLHAANYEPPLACVQAAIAALKPEALQQYHQQTERPIDINFIVEQLEDNESYTVSECMRDLELFRAKTTDYFGPNHDLTYIATSAITSMLDRMDEFPAEKFSPKAANTLETLIWQGRRIAVRGIACTPVRGMVYRHGTPWDNNQPPAGDVQFPHLIVQLGRLCVAQSPDARMYATRHMVVMDVGNPRKALWVFWYYYTVNQDTGGYPLLPIDQEALLGRHYLHGLSKLADDINLWTLGRLDGGGLVNTLFGAGSSVRDGVYVPDGISGIAMVPKEVVLARAWNDEGVKAFRLGWGIERRGSSSPRVHGRDEDEVDPDEPSTKRKRT
ncbi:hypothetical protein VPNG_05523 [Cytospora leucostoma]|uniref:Bromo domain-containing protein n=1 Tax=Cytospora leucostoma TaxID=1230097 RepID=A0A423XBI8_9PEZI|nr:hypothetical protein VPNG_05523 [Cytospora leucostoma]